MVQANSISVAFNTAFGAPMIVVGIICAIIAAFIFLGGVGRIASVTEKVVPIMALFYMAGCIVILCINHAAIIPAFKSIFVAAFDPQAILGGAAGITVRQAMRYGVARGLFSNEAGMGSTPHAHALAKVKRPQGQGEIAIVSVFIDTFIVLTLTAMVILTSGMSIRVHRTVCRAPSWHRRPSRLRLARQAWRSLLSACCSSRSLPSSAGISSVSRT